MSTPNDTPTPDVLDTSGEGGPFIPASVIAGAPVSETTAAADEELLVEVELAPDSEPLAAVLAQIGGLESVGILPEGSSLSGAARTHGLIEARPVFSPQQVERDQTRLKVLRDLSGAESAAEQLSPERLERLERLPPLWSFVRLRFPRDVSPSAVVKDLEANPDVVRAVVVPQAAPPALPNDPMIGVNGSSVAVNPVTGFEPQWYLHRTGVLQAWALARGAGVVIADVDWGFHTSHRDFGTAIEKTFNARDGSTNVTGGPKVGHGTGVLGLAAARADGAGLAGYAPESALWAIQGNFSIGAPIFTEPWAEAIDFVRRTSAGNRRKVIIVEVETTAGGNFEQVPSVRRAILAAIAENCVVCVAAGNGRRPVDRRDDTGEVFAPTGSILVGATAFHNTQNRPTFFTNFGERIVVSAPGDGGHDVTCSAREDNAYRNGFGGTSGAVAKVAGTAALMLSVNPNLSHDDVLEILRETGSPIVTDPGEPIGVFLNAGAAVQEAKDRLP